MQTHLRTCWVIPHHWLPVCAGCWAAASVIRQVRDKYQQLSVCDTVSGCHGEIGDGSSPQVSARVQPEAEAESNLISETMTWLCARARSRATGKATQSTEHTGIVLPTRKCVCSKAYTEKLLIQEQKQTNKIASGWLIWLPVCSNSNISCLLWWRCDKECSEADGCTGNTDCSQTFEEAFNSESEISLIHLRKSSGLKHFQTLFVF